MINLASRGALSTLLALLFLLSLPNCQIEIDDPPPVNPGKEPIHLPCRGNSVTKGDLSKTPMAFPTCYVPNQIISNTTVFDATSRSELFDYLEQNNFQPLRTCDCEEELILWQHPGIPPDLHGVVDGAPPPPPKSVGNGLSLNYRVEFPNNEGSTIDDPKAIDSLNNILPQVPNNKPKVRVGVSDSGTGSNPLLDTNQTYPGGSGCGLAVIDHPLGLDMYDFANSTLQDHTGHGSLVSGVVAGVSIPAYPEEKNEVAIELIHSKITEGTGAVIDLFQAVCGLYYLALQDVNVINISWGFRSPEAPTIFTPFLDLAMERHIVISAAAGNDYSLVKTDDLFWPAGFSRWAGYKPDSNTVIAVAAYREDSGSGPKLPDFTNRGKDLVDVVAPGVGIASIAQNPGAFQRADGTSYAAPYVARTAALLRGLNPGKSALEIKQCIINSAAMMPSNDPNYSPMPVFDHAAALSSCGNGVIPVPKPSPI